MGIFNLFSHNSAKNANQTDRIDEEVCQDELQSYQQDRSRSNSSSGSDDDSQKDPNVEILLKKFDKIPHVDSPQSATTNETVGLTIDTDSPQKRKSVMFSTQYDNNLTPQEKIQEARRKTKQYSVMYDSANHIAVLTQIYGSLWPRVIPYCILNVCTMFVLSYLNKNDYIHLKVTSTGHSFISVVVAFLLVSRVNTALSRFNESRTNLATMYRECRELISNMAVLTAPGNDDEEAKEWRNEVAYRMLLLLRTAMAVIDYPTDFIPAWDVPELSGEEKQDIGRNTYLNPQVRKWAHNERSEFEESMRVPIRIAYLLRKSINSNRSCLRKPLPLPAEIRLLGYVDKFMGGYYGMRKFLTTPVPFPLVQMARTFLFAYVFTIPFALLSDDSTTFAHCVETFILTYGFMGLELVAIEMDNPYGDDENNFDNLSLARVNMEDAYLTILDVDGEEWCVNLRERLGYRSNADKRFSDDFYFSERSALIV